MPGHTSRDFLYLLVARGGHDPPTTELLILLRSMSIGANYFKLKRDESKER